MSPASTRHKILALAALSGAIGAFCVVARLARPHDDADACADEFFDMSRDRHTVHLTFPQTNRAADVRFTVRECSDHKPFDLCLDLSRNPWGGPTHYFGFSNPEDEQKVLGAIVADAREDARRRRD